MDFWILGLRLYFQVFLKSKRDWKLGFLYVALAGTFNVPQFMEKIENWDFGILAWTACPSFSLFTEDLGDWNFFSFRTAWKKEFRLTKICEKGRKDHIFVSFHMFQFHGNIIFSELSFKRKCKKASSFRKCVFLSKWEIFIYNSWFNYTLTIFKQKDGIFYVALQRKQPIGQLLKV